MIFSLNNNTLKKSIGISGVYLVNRLNTNSSRELVSAYWL